MSAPLHGRVLGRGGFRATMLALATLGLLVASLPVVMVVVMSFSGGDTLDFPPESFSLRWYEQALHALRTEDDGSALAAMSALKTSWMVGMVTLVVAVVACVPLAYALSRSSARWRQSMELLFTMPMVFPLVVLGVSYLLLAETLARATGGEPGLARLVVPHITLVLPFVLRNCLSAMHGIGAELEEAAQSLGAPPLRAAWDVVAPLMRPGILAGCIFAFIISFNEFTVTFFMYTIDLGTLPIWMYSRTVSAFDPATLAISSLVVLLDVVLIVWVDKLIAGKGSLF